jgi:dihydrofolate reductase
VFGGPWKYSGEGRAEAEPDDAAWMDDVMSRIGAVVAGRWTYEAARHWGDKNPWGLPLFIVTHRPEEQPSGGEFQFVDGVEPAIDRAVEAAGGRDINIMGGADTIRQALAAGRVDGLTIIVAPVILGAGKGLFDGFSQSIDLEHLGVRQSRFATFIDYRVKRS